MKNSFLNKIKYAKKYLLGSEFHNEHFDAAIDILDIMASKEPHTNHIILDAPTQSGKTSVMEMVYRILNFEQTYVEYGIEQIIYMTSDNGSGEGSLKFQTINRFKNHWKNYVHSLPIEFLKRSDFDKFTHVMNNTLIMVDESQYGFREIFSKGQTLLQINGVNFCSADELEKRNTFILSVSATTQNERYGDSPLKMKPIVRLKPGKGYIGFKDFFENDIVKSVSKSEFIDSYDKLNDFLSKQRKKLSSIYKKTGTAKCVILRLVDNKRKGFITDSEDFENIVEANGFIYKLVTCKDSKIDYVSLQSNIFYNCSSFADNGKKFYLIVIKYAFSYGITIESKIKKLIATCYDVRKDPYTTEATEQGLMGRMSGYGCSIEDFEGLEIYVNETHYNGIKECVVNNNNIYSTPLKKRPKTIKVKCEKKNWDGDENKIVIWNNENQAPLEFKGKIVDDFVSKHSKDINWKLLFEDDKIVYTDKNGRKASFFEMIASTFLKENGISKKMGFGDITFDFRRKKDFDDGYSERMCTNEPLFDNKTRKGWRTEENADKHAVCWGAVIDVTHANKKTFKGIIIKIPYGTVGYSSNKEIETTKYNKLKKWPGYDTSINNKMIIAKETIV